MKVWVDISNAPHVHFFKHIVIELRKENEVIVTARKFGDIGELLRQCRIDYIMVGEHGSSDHGKLIKSAERILGLARLFKHEKPDLALFKHSVEAARVSFGLRIPSFCILDNETAQAQNRLMLPLATRVIAPSCIPLAEIRRFGVDRERISFFHGFCELAHVAGFKPSNAILKELGLSRKKKTVVLRPEPFMADYCRRDPKRTISLALTEESDVQYVIFPRSEEQRTLFRVENIIMPDHAVDALSLMHHSDLVISAGGTMNREAIALNTPAI